MATIGTAVQPGRTLATIEPPIKTLTVTAHIPSRDIGFILVGDTTSFKVSSYPFEHYGMILGRVTCISPTAATTNTVAPGRRESAGDQHPGAHHLHEVT